MTVKEYLIRHSDIVEIEETCEVLMAVRELGYNAGAKQLSPKLQKFLNLEVIEKEETLLVTNPKGEKQ